MVTRSLCRRLERLEQRLTPTTVRKVWQIVIVHPDGTREKEKNVEGGTRGPFATTFQPLENATDNVNYLRFRPRGIYAIGY